MRPRFPQFFGRNQVEQIDLELAQDEVCAFQGELSLAFEDVVQVRLGESRNPREASFGSIAAANAVAQIVDEPSPQIVKGHEQAISPRNRVVPDWEKSNPATRKNGILPAAFFAVQVLDLKGRFCPIKRIAG
jgi:hypothetical protein